MNRPALPNLRKTKPHGGNRRVSEITPHHIPRSSHNDPGSIRIPGDWRDRLPDPMTYYGQRVAQLGQPNRSGYAVGLCPFHDDHTPSLGLKLTHAQGRWICYAGCGSGDLVTFHQRLTGMDFKAAVRDLIRGGR